MSCTNTRTWTKGHLHILQFQRCVVYTWRCHAFGLSWAMSSRQKGLLKRRNKDPTGQRSKSPQWGPLSIA
eukprot:2794823-Karenia_brevis.AAC.1